MSDTITHIKNKIDLLFLLSCIIYFLSSVLSTCFVALAIFWYIQSNQPILDWIDPDGPGYRVISISKSFVGVKWLQLRRNQDCPGNTQIDIIGENLVTFIQMYPIIVETERMTFIRRYYLPPDLNPGNYQIRITIFVKCNPLFESKQVVKIPFTLKQDSSH